MVNRLVIRKLAISIVLLIVALALFIQGASVSEGSTTRDVTIATYYIGAAIVFAIALIPWVRE